MARGKIHDSLITLPERPAFGTIGGKVKLWSNSYTVNLRADSDLWVCNVEVQKVFQESAPAAEGTPTKESDTPPGFREVKAVKGPQLASVIAEVCRLLRKSNPTIALATELKSKLVATKPIVVPNDLMEVTMPDGTFIVSFEGGQSIDVRQMMRYIQDQKDEDARCPKFEEAVNALNIVLGHTARNDAAVSVIGAKRFFNTAPAGTNANPERRDLFYGLLGICRGYFQSLRLSTGRLLLNTNVTYGVFRLQGEISEYFRRANISRRNPDAAFDMMARLLNRARVEYRFKLAEGEEFRTQRKTIMGIYLGEKVADEDIRIVSDGAIPGPGQVLFKKSKDSTEYISVLDHYKTSK
ncbi:hypothetical protein IMZ48_24015 [Candidatus Bathyarchaeota archaeon]|nr:hypothetical protein [Candidatus Bathyarchaeota archaeon]